MYNISPSIEEKRKLKLHINPKHPVCQLKSKIQEYFPGFTCFDTLSEVVTLAENFDSLLISANHPARAVTDTYYVDANHVLRTHTSAHQTTLLQRGETKFLVTGDVYRKDTIDRTHYPVFHQMEGVKLLPTGTDALSDLTKTLEGLIHHLFPGKEYRFLDDYFPFTTPSIQAEVQDNGQWVEILGAGVIHPQILANSNVAGTGWAFGLGIDRLLLNYCSIPDIRLLWSTDERFMQQFKAGLTTFQPYSKYPAVIRDISFWIKDYAENIEGLWSRHNDFSELCREIGQDLIESIIVLDKYTKADAVSLAYRIVYQSNDRTLLNEEVNEFQERIRTEASRQFGLILR
ncbi:PheS-related mystery ligase SrmL [Adhaeribacter radiodurans]|uniref:phenylalanine--tRNA ligase n=1 Tax=Adhaeribacter radiodurans TaxID=2745197 RepID=A0A7L7LA78_9BACT|nr:hypothetical protein [Adhaeribacter radiodurans]QMU29752.1 hypothetical protein HUW48_17745 [Adhaeribacter radiodurans]